MHASASEIELYVAPTGYDCDGLKGFKLEHTWLSTEFGPHNWNCYGRGRGNNNDPDARRLAVVHGNVRWMAEVYGTEAEGRSGRGDDDPAAAGVVELLHGVCQNATNRMLAMTEENLDVSNAEGNELVVLAFGKYGFGVDSFIKRLSETATRLNARNPGTVSEEELLRTLSNVKAGTMAGAEFEALMDDLPEIRAAFMAKTTILQRDEFAKKYAAFQSRREEKFSSLDKRDMPNHDARAQVAAFLQVELSDLLGHVRKCVGADVYAQIVSALPCEAWNVLTKIV